MTTIVLGKDDFPREMELRGKSELTFVAPKGWSGTLDLRVDLVQSGAELDLAAMYLADEGDEQHFKVLVRHLVPGCRSHQDLRGVISGKASFEGLIHVAKGAGQTEAYQENHTILLSDKASVDTSPQLEIYADDVKCSHGATSGKLDEEAFFYMRSRGIPEAKARELQILSFLSPVLSRIEEGQKYL